MNREKQVCKTRDFFLVCSRLISSHETLPKKNKVTTYSPQRWPHGSRVIQANLKTISQLAETVKQWACLINEWISNLPHNCVIMQSIPDRLSPRQHLELKFSQDIKFSSWDCVKVFEQITHLRKHSCAEWRTRGKLPSNLSSLFRNGGFNFFKKRKKSSLVKEKKNWTITFLLTHNYKKL